MSMKRLFIAFASLAMVALFATSCKSDEQPTYTKTIKITPSELTIVVGKSSEPLEVKIEPEQKVRDIKWFVSDKAIADINTRTLVVKGLKEGSCTIKAVLYDADRNIEAATDLTVKVTAAETPAPEEKK